MYTEGRQCELTAYGLAICKPWREVLEWNHFGLVLAASRLNNKCFSLRYSISSIYHDKFERLKNILMQETRKTYFIDFT